MPRRRRTEQEIEQMRNKMLDAALVLLRDGGPSAVSIRALAEQVGVSHMVFYTYFDSRADLMRTLSQRQRERISQRRAEILQEAERGDVVEVTRRSLEHYARISDSLPRVFELLWVHCIDDREEGLEHPEAVFARNVDHLRALVELGIQRGHFCAREPLTAAATAFSIVMAPLLLYHNGRITDRALRDGLVQESLAAAMLYLSSAQEE